MKRNLMLLFLLSLLFAPTTHAFTPKKVISFSFGSYSVSDGTDSVIGSRISLGYKNLFDPNWAYFGSLYSGSAEGTHSGTTSGTDYLLTASHNGVTGGIEWRADFSETMVPFVGGGMVVESYTYDYTYPNSDIGTTSGTAVGPLANAGIRFHMSKNFIFIPTYQYHTLQVTTESGDTKNVTSAGLLLALVLRF